MAAISQTTFSSISPLRVYLILHLYLSDPLSHMHISQVSLKLSCGNACEISTPCSMGQLGMFANHYNDVIMSAIASQIISLTIHYSTVCSGTDQRKQQNSASLAFVRWIHWCLVNSPHKWPVTWKMFPLDDVIYNNNIEEYPCMHTQVLWVASCYSETIR